MIKELSGPDLINQDPIVMKKINEIIKALNKQATERGYARMMKDLPGMIPTISQVGR